MKHIMNVSVSKPAGEKAKTQCLRVSIRERTLKKIFGNDAQMIVLIPGSSIQTLAITEVPEGGGGV